MSDLKPRIVESVVHEYDIAEATPDMVSKLVEQHMKKKAKDLDTSQLIIKYIKWYGSPCGYFCIQKTISASNLPQYELIHFFMFRGYEKSEAETRLLDHIQYQYKITPNLYK